MKNLKRLVDLGRDCRIWREEHGHTQKEIAVSAGYTQQLVSMYERGMANNALILAAYVERGFPINGEKI